MDRKFLRQVEVLNIVIAAIVLLAGIILCKWDAFYGLMLGSLLSVVNFRVLSFLVDKIILHGSKRKKFSIFLLLSKFSILLLIIFLIFKYIKPDPVMFLIGISTIIVSILIASFFRNLRFLISGNSAKIILNVIVLLSVMLCPSISAAGSSEETGGSGHEQGSTPDEDHWSIMKLILPGGFVSEVKKQFGRSFMEGKPVSKISHIFMTFIILVFSVILALFASRRLKRLGDQRIYPQKKINPLLFFEILIDAILKFSTDVMGQKKAMEFLPLLGSIAIFILLSNLLGLFPGFLPPTDNINTTFALGSFVFFSTHYYGIKHHGLSYFKEFLGPIRKWYALPLIILMVFIETISHLVRPVSLAVRLLGNMFGDHMALMQFVGLALFLPVVLFKANPVVGIAFGWLGPVLPPFVMCLGLVVCFVQALVFFILSAIYIEMATSEHG
jgi:F-type H+-transporting ATPase subunit a